MLISAIIIKISHSAPPEYKWGGIGNEKQENENKILCLQQLLRGIQY